jgi:hypothetical protein
MFMSLVNYNDMIPAVAVFLRAVLLGASPYPSGRLRRGLI